MRNGKDTASCTAVAGRASIICDLPALKLAQGKQYTLAVDRSYNGSQSAQVLSQKVKTLTATTIVSGSIEQDQVVYDKPKSFAFQTDKPLRSAKMTIRSEDKDYPMTVTIENNKIVGSVDDNLVRGKRYTLSIGDV